MVPTLTVFEGGRLDLPGGAIGSRTTARLLGITLGTRPAFILRKGAVFACDLVGAVDLGTLKVEVLPKPYGIDSIENARALMSNLLGWAGSDVNALWLGSGSDARPADILGIVQRRAAAELLRRLEVGVPRRYQEVSEISSTLRGRIQFSGLARRLPSDAARMPLQYSPLVADNGLGRLLKALATLLRDRSDSYAARRDLDLCIDLLGAVADRPLTSQMVRQVRLGRMEEGWSGLVELARLLAQGLGPDPANLGDTHQSTLLFPMERLFEAAIRRLLAEHLPKPLVCARSPGEHELLALRTPAGTEAALAVRPDLLFRSSAVVVAAGDVKWKRLEDRPPRFSILPSDAYQLLAYMRLFSVPCGLLFFPRATWMPEDWSCEFLVSPSQQEQIVVLSVDILQLVDRRSDKRTAAARALATRVAAALRLTLPGGQPMADELLA